VDKTKLIVKNLLLSINLIIDKGYNKINMLFKPPDKFNKKVIDIISNRLSNKS